jgi:hypothetical protein
MGKVIKSVVAESVHDRSGQSIDRWRAGRSELSLCVTTTDQPAQQVSGIRTPVGMPKVWGGVQLEGSLDIHMEAP